MPQNASFKRTARGPIIKRLQQKLLIAKPDGFFGRYTQEAVRIAQRQHNLPETGNADRALFGAIGLQWPDEFLRCMNLTSVLEGTTFGGVNTRDIDGFGITMGIIGFTSRTGEVQQLFHDFYLRRPDFLQMLSDPARRQQMEALVRGSTSADTAKQWNDFAYGESGIIREDFATLLYRLENDNNWQGLQLTEAKKRCWEPAMLRASEYAISSMAGHGLFYDIYVQNGSWRRCHQDFYRLQTVDGNELTKLRAVARAAAHCATREWQHDVLSRKMCFVETAGMVHGTYFDLGAYAFDGIG